MGIVYRPPRINGNAETTRNMMNNFGNQQRPGQAVQDPNGGAMAAVDLSMPGTSMQNPHHNQQQQQQQFVFGNMSNLGHPGTYAGMTLPPTDVPSTSTAMGAPFGLQISNAMAMAGTSSSAGVVVGGNRGMMGGHSAADVKVEPGENVLDDDLFTVKVDQPLGKYPKYTWAQEFNRLYAMKQCPIPIHVKMPSKTDLYVLRGRLIYEGTNETVPRCGDCLRVAQNGGDVAKSEFVFRYSDNVADYKLLDTGNRVVDYPLTPAVNDSFITRLLVEFACRNSDDKSRGKVERVLRFELYRRCPTTEQPLDDVLLGVAEIKVRVCASPMRDYEKDKAKAKPPMPGRSGVGSSGWKMSLPESESSTSSDDQLTHNTKVKKEARVAGTSGPKKPPLPADYIENLRRKKRVYITYPANASEEEHWYYKELFDCSSLKDFVQACHPEVYREFVEIVRPGLSIRTADIPPDAEVLSAD